MSDERKAEDVLRDWSRLVVPRESADLAERRRDRVVSQIARQIALSAERGRRGQKARALVAALMVAAAAVLVASIAHRRAPLEHTAQAAKNPGGESALTAAPSESVGELHGALHVSVYRGGVPVPAWEGFALALGDEVRTASQAKSELRVGSGALVSIEPESRVSVERPQAIEVAQGEVGVSVPKLGAGSFVVRTPDARVVVHGTRFIVSVGAVTERPRTRVRVLEGRVSVEYEGREAFVGAGESWPAVEPRPSGATQTSAASPVAPATALRAGKSVPEAKPDPSHPAVASSRIDPAAARALAEQNRLFSAAVAARRSGDERTALTLLDELLAKHPTTQLAPEARVERFRALKRLGRDSEAAREASRYLLEHENGAARDEAREIVLPGSNHTR